MEGIVICVMMVLFLSVGGIEATLLGGRLKPEDRCVFPPVTSQLKVISGDSGTFPS